MGWSGTDPWELIGPWTKTPRPAESVSPEAKKAWEEVCRWEFLIWSFQKTGHSPELYWRQRYAAATKEFARLTGPTVLDKINEKVRTPSKPEPPPPPRATPEETSGAVTPESTAPEHDQTDWDALVDSIAEPIREGIEDLLTYFNCWAESNRRESAPSGNAPSGYYDGNRRPSLPYHYVRYYGGERCDIWSDRPMFVSRPSSFWY